MQDIYQWPWRCCSPCPVVPGKLTSGFHMTHTCSKITHAGCQLMIPGLCPQYANYLLAWRKISFLYNSSVTESASFVYIYSTLHREYFQWPIPQARRWKPGTTLWPASAKTAAYTMYSLLSENKLLAFFWGIGGETDKGWRGGRVQVGSFWIYVFLVQLIGPTSTITKLKA